MAAKKRNAEINDNGQISSFTNHLAMDDTKTFEDIIIERSGGTLPTGNPAAGKGINILNLGDSVAHGDYT